MVLAETGWEYAWGFETDEEMMDIVRTTFTSSRRIYPSFDTDRVRLGRAKTG